MLSHPTCPMCGGNHGERCPSALRRWSATVLADGRFYGRFIVEAVSSDEAMVRLVANLLDDRKRWPKGAPRLHVECLEIPA